MMSAAFAPFLEKAPLCVITRLSLEWMFQPDRLDALFRDTADRQVAVHSLKAIRTKKSENWRSWQGIGLIGCRHGGNRSTY
jgi:hypothetical protein